MLQDSTPIGCQNINEHEQLLRCPKNHQWVGGQTCLCVALFLGEKGDTLTKILGNLLKMMGQSRDNPVKISFICF